MYIETVQYIGGNFIVPAVTRLGDSCTGHGSWPPRPSTSASPNVYANGIPVHRQGDSWAVHCNPLPECHGGTLASGSSSVYVNGKQIGRIGDLVSCGSSVASGSSEGNIIQILITRIWTSSMNRSTTSLVHSSALNSLTLSARGNPASSSTARTPSLHPTRRSSGCLRTCDTT